MTINPERNQYQAFLLRFWSEFREDPDENKIWRFSLEDPHTGQVRGFANLKALMRFLRSQISTTKKKI